jgi:hypothetical protein
MANHNNELEIPDRTLSALFSTHKLLRLSTGSLLSKRINEVYGKTTIRPHGDKYYYMGLRLRRSDEGIV